MSGGSWDYEYVKLEELADRLEQQKCPYRKAMANRVRLLAEAMHDIEWVDSCDLGKGEELTAIKAFLETDYPHKVIEQVVEDGKRVIKEFKKLGIEI